MRRPVQLNRSMQHHLVCANLFGLPRDQDMGVRVNWNCREVVDDGVIAAAEELMLLAEQANRSLPVVHWLAPKTIELGYAKLAWFRMLKSSARNWSVYRSLIWNFLKKEVSTSTKPGPRNDPRETLPKVPATGIRNALGLKY